MGRHIFLIAIISALLVFTGIAVAAAEIAKVICVHMSCLMDLDQLI